MFIKNFVFDPKNENIEKSHNKKILLLLFLMFEEKAAIQSKSNFKEVNV